MSTTVQDETTADGSSADGLSQEVAFETLSCRRRRYVLHYLLQQGRNVELRELSTEIAAWENDIAPEEVTYKQRMRVYTALKQSHLPKMHDHGIVEFSADRNVVALTEDTSELEVYLDIVPHDEIAWSKYYLGLSVLSSGLVGVATTGLPPFDLLPGLAWAGVITAILAGSAVAHIYHDRKMRLGSEGEPPV